MLLRKANAVDEEAELHDSITNLLNPYTLMA
jgi:hypothetical protein